jgi:glycerol kinase
MTQCILALDQAAASSRAILFDHAGQTGGIAQQEFRQIFPQPCRVEHDANETWPRAAQRPGLTNARKSKRKF